MTQTSIFDAPLARSSDPETSHQAAASVRPHAKRDRDRALDALRAAPSGLTDFQLGDAIGRVQTSAGKRRHELMKAGLVEFSGEFRLSPSGAKARVWKAT